MFFNSSKVSLHPRDCQATSVTQRFGPEMLIGINLIGATAEDIPGQNDNSGPPPHMKPQDDTHINTTVIARSLHQNSELLSGETLVNRSINCCSNHSKREKNKTEGQKEKGVKHEATRVLLIVGYYYPLLDIRANSRTTSDSYVAVAVFNHTNL